MHKRLLDDDIEFYLNQNNDDSGSDRELDSDIDDPIFNILSPMNSRPNTPTQQSSTDLRIPTTPIQTTSTNLGKPTAIPHHTNTNKDYVWEEQIASGPTISLANVPKFTEQNKPTVSFEKLLSPEETFHKFFPESVYELVAEETNKYAWQCFDVTTDIPKRSRLHSWHDITANDVKAFTATQIAMGLVSKPTEESYFQDNFWLTKTPAFSKIFSRDKYQLMKSFLHFNNNESQKPKGDPDYDPLYKIRPLLELTKNKYVESYEPGEALSIDESMLKFKGRLSFKQYLPSKPSTKWGIKIWSLCDSKTGFLLRFQVYTGKESSNVVEGLGSRVVKSLLKGFEFTNRIVYMDNFYSGVNLFDDMIGLGLGACGTVRGNRKNLPQEMKTIKKKKGDLPSVWVTKDKTMISCTWQDTGKVNMLSTVGDSGVSDVQVRSKTGNRAVVKPNIQIMYNSNMGGVDLFDQFCSTYPYGRKSMKWYQPLWHFLIEVGLVNGCISYNLQKDVKPLTHKKFREQVIDGLLSNWERSTATRRGRKLSNPLDDRMSGKIHFIGQFEDKSHKPNCAVCSILPSSCSKKGKGVCKRKQTTYYCKTCLDQPPLCVVPCFEVFHSVKVYKKKCTCT